MIEPKCLFCRHPVPNSEAGADRCVMKRAEASNDPVAIRFLGIAKKGTMSVPSIISLRQLN